ncbi:unnamed protein product [Schistosoma intercalatum]|nr:unnamed protein product [Schistosoma intercalatum]
MHQDVKYLLTGIRNGLTGNLTKHSSLLNQNAVYKHLSLISRLPAYLCIHFVRFSYKEDKQINAKILKDVKFPLTLDMHEFCTPELQHKLLPMREKQRLKEDEVVNPSSQTNTFKTKFQVVSYTKLVCRDSRASDKLHNITQAAFTGACS